MDFSSRRRAVLRRCGKSRKIDALLVSEPVDVGYLSGFTGDSSVLLIAGPWACLVTDGRFGEQARGECPDIDVIVRTKGVFDVVGEVVKDRKVRNLAIQSGHMTVQWRGMLSEKLGSRRKIHDISGIVGLVRQTKDAEEIRCIRKAIRIAERALKDIISGGVKSIVRRTEQQLAARLEYRMRLFGASEAAFETIVAAGPHGSLCHYRPGSTVIRQGDPVLIDFGAKVDGYCSDLTRVLFMGKIPPKIAGIYKVVLQAQRAGIKQIRPGVSCKRVDSAARKVIETAGYGDKFVHSLGHGVGLQVHEAPALAQTSKARLRGGMIVTVEPGIYLPGVGGVRIEDDVQVTLDGHKKLSTLSRDINAMVVQ